MTARRIHFANPVFKHEAHNVTCRKDTPKYNDLTIGECIEVCDLLDGKVIGNAVITGLSVHCGLDTIPQHLLDMEHDPSCRTHNGLLRELKRVYPEFTTEETVLVIQFVYWETPADWDTTIV